MILSAPKCWKVIVFALVIVALVAFGLYNTYHYTPVIPHSTATGPLTQYE